MDKPSTYLVVAYFPTYLCTIRISYIIGYQGETKPNNNSIEVYPQLSNNGHPVDGALVGASLLRPTHS
jgi:hypothetical protein